MIGVHAEWMLRLEPDWDAPIPAASSAGLIEHATSIVGSAPVAWAVQHGHAMAVTIATAMPEYGDSGHGFEVLRMGTEATTVQSLIRLATGFTDRAATSEALEGVGDFVRRGIRLEAVLRGVRLGHAQMARGFLAGCERLVPAESRIAEAKRISEELFDYIDAFSAAMSEHYVQEQVHWSTSELAARRALVVSLLREQVADVATASRRLGYPLAGAQLGFVVWTDGTAANVNTAEVQRTVVEVFRRLPIRDHLVLPEDAGTVWAWVSGGSDLREAIGEAVGELPPGMHLAVGRPGRGLTGFRRSHAQALAAAHLGRTTVMPGGMVFYQDVELLSLLLHDRERAVDFAMQTLGALWDDTPQTHTLRATLQVFIQEQSSGQAVARRMHLARNTVAYRVQRAEEAMGIPLAARTAEVYAALLIAEALPAIHSRTSPPSTIKV